MDKNKYFIVITLFGTILILSSIFLFNYSIDPVRIKHDVTSRTQKFNDIFKYNPRTIMLGGSRVQFLSSYHVKKYTKDIVYNISMSNMTLYEQLHYIKFAIKNFNINRIIIGLNFYTFGKKAKDKEGDFNEDLLKNGINIKYIADNIKTYLTYSITSESVEIYFNQDKYKKNRMFDKYGSRTLFMQKEVIGNINWDKRSKSTIKSYDKTFKNFILSNKKMNYYKNIVELCKVNNIELIVFTTPIHDSLYYLAINHASIDVFKQWKFDLANIHNYYDFMYPNSITTNNKNYIDVSHIKQEYGKFIFAKLFNDTKINTPNDFGKYITKDNINSYLKQPY